MSGRTFALLVSLLAASGCVALPHATPLDAELAQDRWPGTSMETLEADRRLYVGRCSGCHGLYLPSRHTPHEWPKLLDDMTREAKLTAPERVRIERFVLTLASRPVGTVGPAAVAHLVK